SQPISHGTYSASSFIASSTSRAASITSLPIPSPGIQAIAYFAIRSSELSHAFQSFGNYGLRAAGDNKFLGGRRQSRKREFFSVKSHHPPAMLDFNFAHQRRLFFARFCPQVIDEFRAFKNDEAVIERIAFVGLAEAGRNDARNAEELQGSCGLFA